MERDLEEVRKNMRGYIFGDNVRRAVVLGPAPLMAKMGVDCCWADDPVHPLPAVYTELAKLVMSNLERLDDKVEHFNAKAQRTGGSVREWRDRRGGHWGRGGGRSGSGGYGGRWAGRGGRERFSV